MPDNQDGPSSTGPIDAEILDRITAEARRKPTPFRGVDEADNWDPIHIAALSRSVISH
jgi:hypothetical protein